MDGGEGYFVARVLTAVFKKRPNCAFVVFTFLIVVVLGAMLIMAENPNDRVFPVLGIAFVLILVLGRAIRAIRQQSIQEYQGFEQAQLDQEKPVDQETMMPDTVEKVSEAPQRKQPAVPYPSWKKGYFRRVLIICVIFFALGYLMAYLLGTNILAKLLTQIIPNLTVTEAKTDLSTIRIPFLQLICVLPCAFFAFLPILLVLHNLLIRFTNANLKTLKITHAILSFIFGVLVFGPMQIFMLFASAF